MKFQTAIFALALSVVANKETLVSAGTESSTGVAVTGNESGNGGLRKGNQNARSNRHLQTEPCLLGSEIEQVDCYDPSTKQFVHISGSSRLLIDFHDGVTTSGTSTLMQEGANFDDGEGSLIFPDLANVQYEQDPEAPLPPTEIFPKVKAIYYDVQSGTQLVGNGAGAYIGHIDTNSYLTYNSLNFGPSGTTKSVKIRYAKDTIDGQLELRIGGPTGALIGEYSPSNTGDWFNFTTVYIEIDDVIGFQDLTLVGKGGSGVMNIDWFKLSDYEITLPPTPTPHPHTMYDSN